MVPSYQKANFTQEIGLSVSNKFSAKALQVVDCRIFAGVSPEDSNLAGTCILYRINPVEFASELTLGEGYKFLGPSLHQVFEDIVLKGQDNPVLAMIGNQILTEPHFVIKFLGVQKMLRRHGIAKKFMTDLLEHIKLNERGSFVLTSVDPEKDSYLPESQLRDFFSKVNGQFAGKKGVFISLD